MKKLLLASALLTASFSVNSAMAAPVDYTFSGSNNPINVETPGTVMGTFTLDTVAGADSCTQATCLDYSFTMNHNGINNTFASDDASLSLFDFSWTTDGLGELTSIIFDADIGNKFLFLVWDIAGNSNRNDAGNANRFEYGPTDTLGRVFLDNANASVSAVPIPAAAFLFAPALMGFLGLRRKAKNSVA